MNNTTRVRKTNQAWQQKDCKPLEYIAHNPVQHITALPQKHKDLINYILDHENKNHAYVYPTQTTLGKAIGCGRQRANEIVGELQDLGLIDTNYRHMTSCLYKTSSFLRSPFMAQKLGHLFPALRKLLLLLSIPCFGGGLKTEATQLNLKNYNVYNGITDKYINIQKNVEKYAPLSQSLSRQPLTLKQKCVLSAFPEWLIDEAMFKITDMSLIENLGGYLYDYCVSRCSNPDWIWSSKLKDLYKDEPDYDKMPLLLNEDDMRDAYLPHKPVYKKPGGKYPQKGGAVAVQEPRRSPGGMSPMVVTERQPDRLLQLEELQAQLEKYNAMADRRLAELFTTGLMNRQMDLINNLSPQELEYWNIRKGL